MRSCTYCCRPVSDACNAFDMKMLIMAALVKPRKVGMINKPSQKCCQMVSLATFGFTWRSAVQDLAKDAAPLFKKALRFYDGLAADLVKQSHSLDVFACALDQVHPTPFPSLQNGLALLGCTFSVHNP